MSLRSPTYASLACALALCVSSCGRQDAQFQDHQRSFESLGSTTSAITDAWLAGNVSGTYAGTALEQTFLLVEQERTSLAATPQALHDRRGAYLSQAAERLSRVIADLSADVRNADGAAARLHLAQIPIAPRSQP